MRFRRPDEPVLITSAATSRPAEIRSRERRYIISMLFRAVCFLLAVIVFRGWLRWAAVAFALIIPWIAVVLANGGPPRRVERRAGYQDPAKMPDPTGRLEPGRHPVIDQDE
ncbi:MAG: DUF3099 domain-containing protein [Frankia sp.]